MYSNSPYTSQYHEFEGKYVRNIFTITSDLDDATHTDNIDDEFYPDYMSFVKYCAIINNGDDETMYSQLCGVLMKCAIDLKT